MRAHYGPWQPCWISNQHQKHKSGKGPSNEHFWQVWLKSVQRFQRRRVKCEKLTDGRTTDTYPWQKLTWPMARWAKNQKYYIDSQDIKLLTICLSVKSTVYITIPMEQSFYMPPTPEVNFKQNISTIVCLLRICQGNVTLEINDNMFVAW